MFRRLLATPNSPALALIRIALGVVIFAHGAQKALGWFGGYGLSATVGFLETFGIPAALAALVIAAEFVGGLGLIFGGLSRVAAFGVLADMLGAIALVHWQNGFFMDWSGQQAGQGFEFHILAIAMALAVLIQGSGALSVDRAVMARVEWAGGGSRISAA